MTHNHPLLKKTEVIIVCTDKVLLKYNALETNVRISREKYSHSKLCRIKKGASSISDKKNLALLFMEVIQRLQLEKPYLLLLHMEVSSKYLVSDATCKDT